MIFIFGHCIVMQCLHKFVTIFYFFFRLNRDSSNQGGIVTESPSDPASLLKVAQWVLSSPFQSPRQTPVKLDTIVISESECPDSSLEGDSL